MTTASQMRLPVQLVFFLLKWLCHCSGAALLVDAGALSKHRRSKTRHLVWLQGVCLCPDTCPCASADGFCAGAHGQWQHPAFQHAQDRARQGLVRSVRSRKPMSSAIALPLKQDSPNVT